MQRKQRLYLLLAIAFTATLAMGIAATAGPMVALIVCGSMAAGIVGWSRTSLRRPTDPARIVPVYLLTVVLLYVHIGEEYLYDFGPRIGALTGTGWTEAQHMLQFGFIVPAFWILAAAALYGRHPLGGFMAWFIFVGMFAGEPTHLLVFPLLEGGRYHYFPGAWTALLPMVMGVWGLHVILQDDHRQRAHSS